MSEVEKPTFQSVEINDIDFECLDRKLGETAVRKRIPSISVSKILEPTIDPPERLAGGENVNSQGAASPRKTLSLEVPDYLWVDLKTTAAQRMITVRHLVLSALHEAGFEIHECDMQEDGRRLR